MLQNTAREHERSMNNCTYSQHVIRYQILKKNLTYSLMHKIAINRCKWGKKKKKKRKE